MINIIRAFFFIKIKLDLNSKSNESCNPTEPNIHLIKTCCMQTPISKQAIATNHTKQFHNEVLINKRS